MIIMIFKTNASYNIIQYNNNINNNNYYYYYNI